ncbi:unnamed protein product [Rotaria sp. Silwood2]|nr:unnamed protein product [Rotaria sp. Silwood2]CAF2767795.1 unnamed protein product [Rotaria sp. Silwood2]CAF3191762.1 unnamed protein product [Rotaria sp. Silwood2]CAF4241848.1 unnamed protein product [Rotaria sp. Silwood2]CAF4335399.1 unnamed protein product [Rotaria sp. Silwood2]
MELMLYKNGVCDVNTRAFDELHAWLANLKSLFGCSDENRMHIDIQVVSLGPVSLMSDFDTLLFIVGSLPDQNIDVISDYMSQLFSGEDTLRIHAVSYDCSHHLVNALLKTITTSASAFASLAST